MKDQNELGKSKYFANRGLPRNKKPLANIIYRIEIQQAKDGADMSKYEKYKFKDLGYLTLFWTKSKPKSTDKIVCGYHGFITIAELKERIGTKQYAKFCQGKREFIIQRRIDGKNISINDK